MAILEDKVKNASGEEVAIYIEVDEQTLDETAVYDVERKTRGSHVPIEEAREAMSKAMTLIHACAEQVGHTLKDVSENARPAACELQFSIKLSAGIAMLAQASTETQLQVTLKWGQQG